MPAAGPRWDLFRNPRYIANDPETATAVAAFCRAIYDKLQERLAEAYADEPLPEVSDEIDGIVEREEVTNGPVRRIRLAV